MTGHESPSDHPDDATTNEDYYEQILDEHQSIPTEIRDEVLERDNYRCQINNCLGTQRGGTARLLVQPLDDSPTHCHRHALANLETRCQRCGRWVAQMPQQDDLDPILQELLNGVEIEGTWAEILQYLADHGPATTGDITENVSLSSAVGVRRALYALMGLDKREPDVTDRIIVKNRVTGEYGLPWQVPEDQYARGIIPLAPSKRRSRILDEFVRRLFEKLSEEVENPREVIASIVDREPLQTYHMAKRAEAFHFPFDQWADTKRAQPDAVSLIEAVDVLAGSTDNLSPQLISRRVSDIFEKHDESELAELLETRAEGGDLHNILRDVTDTRQQARDGAESNAEEPARESAPETDLEPESAVESADTPDEQADSTEESSEQANDTVIDESNRDGRQERSGDWICSYHGD